MLWKHRAGQSTTEQHGTETLTCVCGDVALSTGHTHGTEPSSCFCSYPALHDGHDMHMYINMCAQGSTSGKEKQIEKQ
mgnify:CR=1 FL=1